ncbi:Na+/H+ antiporter [Niabella insulamsoli]|uniref:Na+/H+ antiporter n=1 Tax=Niabella insulamsoli TaxID=3144874 RepID=UPI0031FE25C8
MLEKNLLLVISLLFIITLLTMLGNKLKVAYPIFLVIGGLLISFVPGIPDLRIDPDIVFYIFLPPVLFAASWQIPWADFWRLRQPIARFGFGLVFFTSTIIAFLSQAIIPGFTLALGFVLGGIISPPDAVAATSVLRRLNVPRNIVTLLEGESLVNDASSLIVFRFALLAVMTGRFNLLDATQSFFLMAIGGIFVGLAIGGILYLIHRFFPTTTAIDTALTLVSPFVMYMVAEHFHFSGVLAVVSGGLFISYHSHRIFSYSSRLNVNSVWETVTFLLNGFIFILIGLQLPYLSRYFTHNTIKDALLYGVAIGVAVILIRIFWVFSINYFRRLIHKKKPLKGELLTGKEAFLISWCGMRGVVSLAAALSIPFFIQEDEIFPFRFFILFITFVAILITLVIPGLTIGPLLKWLKIEDKTAGQKRLDEQMIKLSLAQTSLHYIDNHFQEDLEKDEHFRAVKNRYERIIQISSQKLEGIKAGKTKPALSTAPRLKKMLLELISIKRTELAKYLQQRSFDEELIREKERELDLEEARLRSKEV